MFNYMHYGKGYSDLSLRICCVVQDNFWPNLTSFGPNLTNFGSQKPTEERALYEWSVVLFLIASNMYARSIMMISWNILEFLGFWGFLGIFRNIWDILEFWGFGGLFEIKEIHYDPLMMSLKEAPRKHPSLTINGQKFTPKHMGASFCDGS